MSNEQNKPSSAEELTDKELEGIVGGGFQWNSEPKKTVYDFSTSADSESLVLGPGSD